jgi:Uma2 family endonuclease
MATASRKKIKKSVVYATSDGKPMAETDFHRDDLVDTIETLQDRYDDAADVYVSGNILLYYVEGDKRRHVSPDVHVAKGIEKRRRLYYLLWLEKKGPDVVFEITSRSTRLEDRKKKFELYRDVLKVKEYFLFDPFGEYLDPPLQGFRLLGSEYRSIRPLHGRLPSKELGLHLERDGDRLRLYDPATGEYLLTPKEKARQAEAARRAAEADRRRFAEENERLRRELEELRRGLGPR